VDLVVALVAFVAFVALVAFGLAALCLVAFCLAGGLLALRSCVVLIDLVLTGLTTEVAPSNRIALVAPEALLVAE
jgi:hypothetical protein